MTKLRALIAKTGLAPFDVLRRNEATAKELGLNAGTDPEKLIEVMVKHPQLLQRPIVEIGEKAVLARPIERALELIK